MRLELGSLQQSLGCGSAVWMGSSGEDLGAFPRSSAAISRRAVHIWNRRQRDLSRLRGRDIRVTKGSAHRPRHATAAGSGLVSGSLYLRVPCCLRRRRIVCAQTRAWQMTATTAETHASALLVFDAKSGAHRLPRKGSVTTEHIIASHSAGQAGCRASPIEPGERVYHTPQALRARAIRLGAQHAFPGRLL